LLIVVGLTLSADAVCYNLINVLVRRLFSADGFVEAFLLIQPPSKAAVLPEDTVARSRDGSIAVLAKPSAHSHARPRGGPYADPDDPKLITFYLTAPFKPAVSLVGDFNGWNPRAHPMQTDGQGLFWVTTRLTDPTHYRFVVTMDGTGKKVTVADPYAREVRWDAVGPKAFLAIEPPYAWRDRDASGAPWRRPALSDLVIYELCVRDFNGRKESTRAQYGSFRDMRARLDHLVELGVNCVELMPITEFPGDSSWGYNPVFYMAPKWNYGRPKEFKALVDACHERGIAVILDMVFNHAWPDQPYHKMYPPLFGPKGEMLEDLNPFFHHHHNSHANAWGGLDWEHSSKYTVAYMEDIVRFWLQEYRVDGFRFDWLGGVEYDPFRPQTDSFDPFSGIAPIARAARETCPDCYLIGEYWPIHGTNPAKTAAKLVRDTEIDAVWNGAFHHGMENCLFQTWQWELQDMPHVLGGFRNQGFTSATQVVNYVACHDERRPEYEIQHWRDYIQPAASRKNGDGSQAISRYALALQKARLGLAVLLTSPGLPMLLAGQEFGDDSPRTIDFWPLDWAKLESIEGRQQFEFVQRLLRLRREHPALRSDCVEYYLDDFKRHKLVRYKRWDASAGDVVVVVANFDNVSQKAGLGFPHDGWWRNALAGTRHHVQGNWREFTVPAWSALVFVPE
jgi:1,4-alpha-glucan branching enzyme